jgi:iron donor protein CyaY
MVDEAAYRHEAEEVMKRIDTAFADVDPDLAESEYSQGTLVIIFAQKLKLIISPQAPVRQIWAAFRDRAWHFSQDPATQRWLDDRGQGVELFDLVKTLAREQTGLSVPLG